MENHGISEQHLTRIKRLIELRIRLQKKYFDKHEQFEQALASYESEYQEFQSIYGLDEWPSLYRKFYIQYKDEADRNVNPPPKPPENDISSTTSGAPISAKTIVLFADGTWNGVESDEEENPTGCNPSNVLKLFRNLEGQEIAETGKPMEEAERHVQNSHGDLLQVGKYIFGVGSYENAVRKMLSGAGGAGLIGRLVRGYTFISRHYEAGDKIVLVGFSRGAYTARALAEWITEWGLLDRATYDEKNKEEAYALASASWAAWKHYRAERDGARIRDGHANILAMHLSSLLSQLPAWFNGNSPCRTDKPDIEMVAVWDTVGSMGILPRYLKSPRGQKLRRDLFNLTDVRLPQKIKKAAHAIALDEERVDFTPCIWEADARITQCLFPGWHADVGGGYPQNESGLSDCALEWMFQQLEPLIRFKNETSFTPASFAPAHREWQGFPMRIAPRHVREFDQRYDLLLHRSIIERRKAYAVSPHPGVRGERYAPDNLPYFPIDWDDSPSIHTAA